MPKDKDPDALIGLVPQLWKNITINNIYDAIQIYVSNTLYLRQAKFLQNHFAVQEFNWLTITHNDHLLRDGTMAPTTMTICGDNTKTAKEYFLDFYNTLAEKAGSVRKNESELDENLKDKRSNFFPKRKNTWSQNIEGSVSKKTFLGNASASSLHSQRINSNSNSSDTIANWITLFKDIVNSKDFKDSPFDVPISITKEELDYLRTQILHPYYINHSFTESGSEKTITIPKEFIEKLSNAISRYEKSELAPRSRFTLS